MKWVVAVLLCGSAFAQEEPTSPDERQASLCKLSSSLAPSPGIVTPLHVRLLAGVVIWRSSLEKPQPDACLVLETEEGGHPIEMRISDQNGEFDFGKVVPGKYRLRVHLFEGLWIEDWPVEIVRWPRGGFWKSRKVVVHLEVPEIDVYSWAAHK